MLSLVSASHSPLMFKGPASDDDVAAIRNGFKALADFVTQARPQLIIQFAPDHLNGFLYDMMPAFCVGAAARAVGDWGTIDSDLPVPREIAEALADHLLDGGFDIAVSHRMSVDHGFTQIWGEMLGRIDLCPIIPVFVNCAAAPLPRYTRAAALGRAVGAFSRATGKNVLLCASGGLSHDPPLPRIAGADAALRARLLGEAPPTAQDRAAREQRVLDAGARAFSEPALARLNSAWDETVLTSLRQGDLATLEAFDPAEVARTAGGGGNEVLCWLAAYAALQTAGPYDTSFELYRPVPGWLTGMGMTAAISRKQEISK